MLSGAFVIFTWARCYLENALYKTQFAGAQFFNGVRWSKDLKELKYLIRRGKQEQPQHLLEADDYRKVFYDQDISDIGQASALRVELKSWKGGILLANS